VSPPLSRYGFFKSCLLFFRYDDLFLSGFAANFNLLFVSLNLECKVFKDFIRR